MSAIASAVDVALKLATLGVWIALLVSLLSPPGADLFTFHPVLMVTGFVLFMGQGVVAYATELGPLEKTYERSSRRLVHGVLQMLAGGCALAGYLIAFVSNESPDPGDQFAIGSDSTTAMHVWLGYITLLAVLAQCILGMYKMVLKARDDAATCAPWHGTVGPLIFVLGCITASFGCGIWFTDDNNAITGQGAGLIAGILIVALLVLVQLCVCPAASATNAAAATGAKSGGDYAKM